MLLQKIDHKVSPSKWAVLRVFFIYLFYPEFEQSQC